MKRFHNPVKLTDLQLSRIGALTGRDYLSGFRIALGGVIYYFLFYTEGSTSGIEIRDYYYYDADNDGPGYRLTEASILSSCIPGFKKAWTYMEKKGWLD